MVDDMDLHEANIGHGFLVTLSKLFEVEDVTYTWYDGWHISVDSMFNSLDRKYMDVIER